MNSKLLGALAAVALLAACANKNDDRLDRRRRRDLRPGPGQPGRPRRQCGRPRVLRLRPLHAAGRRARDAGPAGRLARQVSAGQRAGGRQLPTIAGPRSTTWHSASAAPMPAATTWSRAALPGRGSAPSATARIGRRRWATTSRPGRRTATRSRRSADPAGPSEPAAAPAAGFACTATAISPPLSGIIARFRSPAAAMRREERQHDLPVGQTPARGISAVGSAGGVQSGGAGTGGKPRRHRAAEPDPGTAARGADAAGSVRRRTRRRDQSRPRCVSAGVGRQRSGRAAAVAGRRARGAGPSAARADRPDAEPGAAAGRRVGQADRRHGVSGAEPAGGGAPRWAGADAVGATGSDPAAAGEPGIAAASRSTGRPTA